ncbi:VOC family protein [Oscillospiraceae bacterium LTW-04]|nr:VOC family protein [Oscillospiraceae bacterium MB24-C1]
MKFHSPMIIVSDIEKSKRFYVDILHEEIEQDLGTYVVFGGGFSMMTREQWNELTGETSNTKEKTGHSFELYFEEDQLNNFAQQLEGHADIIKFTELQEAPWGQRTIRFLDPDHHVVEVSESMSSVVKRFLSSGMTVQETCEKSMMSVTFVEKCRINMAQPSEKG